MKDFMNKRILDENVDLYNQMEKRSGKVEGIKFFFFIILIGTLLYSAMDNKIVFEKYYLLLCGISAVINIFFAFLIHLLAYISISNKKLIIQKLSQLYKLKISSLKEFFWFVISPDYFFAKRFKEIIVGQIGNENCTCYCPRSIKQDIPLCKWDEIKIYNKYFIQNSNWLNLIFSLVLVLFVYSNSWAYDVLLIMFYVFVARVGSRGIEISYAFYTDVVRVKSKTFSYGNTTVYVNNWKGSFLLKSSRISLAVHSLIEIIVTFSSLYYLYYFVSSPGTQEEILNYIGDINFYQLFVYSGLVSVFNESYTADFPSAFWEGLHFIQVYLSIVLIILSVARYIGMSDDISEREVDFYKRTVEEK